jgi:Fe-S-cluster containining protein
MDLQGIINSSQGSPDVKERCIQIYDIYQALEEVQNTASKKAGIFCQPGCGECCTREEPRISPVEGEFAALVILEKKPDLIACMSEVRNRENCVFFDPDNDFHCRIHPFRPLLCRIFHFSAFRNKSGSPIYRPCFVMKEKISVKNPEVLPISEDYGWRLSALDSTMNPELLPVSEAVFQAYQRLSYARSMRQSCDLEND